MAGHGFLVYVHYDLDLGDMTWVKVMTYPWVMDDNCVKYYPDPTWQWGVMALTRILGMCALWPRPWRYDIGSRSWHTLGSWTTIVWNIIQMEQVGTKLWPATRCEQTDGQTDGQGNSLIPPPQTLFAGDIIIICAIYLDTHSMVRGTFIKPNIN